jgi:hypothetical protein
MSAILLFPWSVVMVTAVGFWRKRRKDKKSRMENRGATS